MKRIYVFICSLLLTALFMPLHAREKTKKTVPDTVPLFNSIGVGIDLIKPISAAFNDYYTGLELSADMDLKHRFYPALELGGGHYQRTKNALDYKSDGGFARIGLNYNVFKNSDGINYGYVGLRYGYAFQQYQYQSGYTFGSYWQDPVPINLSDCKAHTHWAEILVGIKVRIYRALSMGWTFRYNLRLGQKDSPMASPYYVPGYGKNGQKSSSFTYSLYYQIPL